MAANLTLGSRSLAADGRTLTATISGGTGTGYAPSSGVTGLSVFNGADRVWINSTAISGTTLTINLGAYVPSTATVTMSISTGSNLTDSGANTAQGQTGVSVTNGSSKTQTNILRSDADVYFLVGLTGSSGNIWGRNWVQVAGVGFGGRFETDVVGTDCNVLVFGQFGNITITVDGGTPVVYTSASLDSGVWYWLPVFSGLSDTAHNVRVQCPYVETSILLGAHGAAVTSEKPAHYGSYLPVRSTTFTDDSVIDGVSSNTSVSSVNVVEFPRFDGAFRFRASCTAVSVTVWGTSGQWVCYRNGVHVGTIQNPSGASAYQLLTLASGLDPTEAEYEVMHVGNGQGYAYGIMLGGGTGLAASSLTAKDRWVFYGDSITTTLNGLSSPIDGRQTDMWQLARAGGAAPARYGLGGQRVSTYGRDNTGSFTGLSPDATQVFVRFGTNDIGTTADATFEADYETMLSNIRTGCPSARIWATGIFPRAGDGTAVAAKNARIQQAIADLGDANIKYLTTDGSMDGNSTTDLPDGLHPSAVGYAKVFAVEVPYVIPATISGPSTGPAGSASSTFTYALPTGGLFASAQTVTLTTSGGTITATSPGGSISGNGTGAVQVTPAAGQSGFTFTFTPSSTGAKTIVPTNGQAWTNPANVTYEATAASSTYLGDDLITVAKVGASTVDRIYVGTDRVF